CSEATTANPTAGAPGRCTGCRKTQWPACTPREEVADGSAPVVLSALFVPHSGRFQAHAKRERHALLRRYALLPRNDDARYNPKSYLRNYKPEPVDALVEGRIHDSKNAVNQAGPQDGRDEASQ